MKIVFLDFDGVCNSTVYMRSLPESERSGVVGLDPAAVARVNRIVAGAGGASVVVSSSWRHGRSIAQLAQILRDASFDGHVRGATPEWLRKSPGGLYAAEARGQEIQAWLDGAPRYGIEVEQFVILDDDSDMAHLADRLVKTSFETGLLDEHVERAVRMLTEPPPLLVLPAVPQK